MTTHVRLVSTIDVATVPRHLNAALNWAFDEGNWRNALTNDVPAHELIPTIDKALERAYERVHEDRSYLEAHSELTRLVGACFIHPDARLVVE